MRIFWFFFTSAFLLTFLSYAFIDPNFFPLSRIYSGFAFEDRGWTTLFYIILITCLYVGYLGIIRMYLKKKVNKAQIIGLFSISSVILLFSYPAMLSYDIFNYLTTAKVLFHYFENPYLVMPIEFVSDPNLLFTHAANKYALYGPSWIAMTGLPYLLGLKNIILSIIGFKVFSILFFFATLSLIYKVSKNLYPVILFGLNPLVLIETLLSLHNDIVLTFFAILSFYFLLNNKKIHSVFSLIFSVLIKYATLALAPVYLYSFIKKMKKKELDQNQIFSLSSYSMLAVFFLSSIREEIYPWYAIWFMLFAFLSKSKFLKGLSIILPFFLLLRYVPFIYLGTHFGPTPAIKISLTFIPVLIYLISFKFINKASILQK